MRARQLGITLGLGTPGEFNAITDVPGIRVGHSTLIGERDGLDDHVVGSVDVELRASERTSVSGPPGTIPVRH